MHPFISRFSFGIALFSTSICFAQITTDGTVGARQTLTGTDMQIGAELGSTRGTNLFHSFQTFDIPTGHSATFTGSDKIQNVISRVTGGKTSNIDGQLRSKVGKADVYLINPSGVVMGPNASVDVPAALHLSTADEVRFSDGSRYSARDSARSSLTIATPESFGFLSPQPAKLIVNGSQLKVNTGKSMTLTGGDIEITSSSVEKPAKLTAPGGAIRIETGGKTGKTVAINKPSEKPSDGQLTVKNARIDTSGDGGGLIAVRAGSVELKNTNLVADNLGATTPVGGIDLSIANALVLSASRIQSNSFANGASGGIRIQAGDLAIRQDGAETLTGIVSEVEPEATGSAGGITITVDGLLEMHELVGIESSTFGYGNGGAITINTNELLMNGEGLHLFYRGADFIAGIASEVAPNASGNAGNVTITVANTLSVLNSGSLSSSTLGLGNAGMLNVRADKLSLNGAEAFLGSAAGTGSTGQAGNMTVTVNDLIEVLNGALILSGTFGDSNAGSLFIFAKDMRIGGCYAFGYCSGMTSNAYPNSTGSAGTINLTLSGLLEVFDGAAITTNSMGAGNAGIINVMAENARFDGVEKPDWFTGIASAAYPESTGQAGAINLTVNNAIEIFNGAAIGTSTYSVGNAGAIIVKAKSMQLDADGNLNHLSGIGSTAEFGSNGNAGTVSLDIDGLLEILNGAEISSSIWGTGNAGMVTVQADALRLDGQFSAVVSSANIGSSGNAGNVNLTIDGLLEVFNGAKISTSTWTTGEAGNVLITAKEALLDGGGIVNLDGGAIVNSPTTIYSDAYFSSTGNAGTVTLNIDGLLKVRNGAAISTNAWSVGDAGTVTLHVGNLLLDGTNSLISSRTFEFATGNVGNIDVVANKLTINNGAQISIAALQTLTDPSTARADGLIHVTANQLELNDSFITSESSGNVPASAIQIDGGYLWLRNSQITTSANTGNGGDIQLNPQYLILEGGFIQANTGGAGAKGGDIFINSPTLITNYHQLDVGQLERQIFIPNSERNSIQAAAPGGEQGNIDILALNLDISASIAPPAAPFGDPDDLLADICRSLNGPLASSLIDRGNGGVPTAATAPVAVSLGGARLNQILNSTLK
ncbi:hypothetical protein CKO09_02415 [Chromatium weissei]|nr:hypothetical protein [Chromatium weissei]